MVIKLLRNGMKERVRGRHFYKKVIGLTAVGEVHLTS